MSSLGEIKELLESADRKLSRIAARMDLADRDKEHEPDGATVDRLQSRIDRLVSTSEAQLTTIQVQSEVINRLTRLVEQLVNRN